MLELVKKGLEDSYNHCEYLSSRTSIISLNRYCHFSTGVIGELLPLEAFKQYANLLVSSLTKEGLSNVARGILTTDLVEKSYSTSIRCGWKNCQSFRYCKRFWDD